MNSLKACLLAAALCLFGCTTVRQLRDPSTLAPTGRAERTRSDDALDYSIATKIDASPETVWAILTDAASYREWNSSIVKLDGKIAFGSEIKLVSKVAPDRTFDLKVTTFDAPKRLVWEDGGSMFLGVRTFTLMPGSEGTTIFAMSETLSGGMLGMIEGSLPDFTKSFEAFASDLKKRAENRTTTASL